MFESLPHINEPSREIPVIENVDEIKDHVKETLDIMAPGGGYVWVPVHNVQSDIPPEKIDTAYQTVLENRKY